MRKSSKVKCEDCEFWISTGEKKLPRGTMFSLSSFYNQTLGYCMSDECGQDTIGYTGDGRGHKMSRRGEILRYCRFFELNRNEKSSVRSAKSEVCEDPNLNAEITCLSKAIHHPKRELAIPHLAGDSKASFQQDSRKPEQNQKGDFYCKKCSKALDVVGYVYGIVPCDNCGYLNWVESE